VNTYRDKRSGHRPFTSTVQMGKMVNTFLHPEHIPPLSPAVDGTYAPSHSAPTAISSPSNPAFFASAPVLPGTWLLGCGRFPSLLLYIREIRSLAPPTCLVLFTVLPFLLSPPPSLPHPYNITVSRPGRRLSIPYKM